MKYSAAVVTDLITTRHVLSCSTVWLHKARQLQKQCLAKVKKDYGIVPVKSFDTELCLDAMYFRNLRVDVCYLPNVRLRNSESTVAHLTVSRVLRQEESCRLTRRIFTRFALLCFVEQPYKRTSKHADIHISRPTSTIGIGIGFGCY